MSTKKEKLLSGEMPITRENLLVLVNSWGRLGSFNAKASNNQMLMIDKCEATQSEQTEFVRKECYDLSKLDVSEITDMSSIFRQSNFNGNISNWNTSNVTDMEWMFFNAKSFNQYIGKWDTSKVTSMEGIFDYAESFNQAINFDTSNVVKMSYMFCNARSFNQELNFNTSKVTNMNYMFYNTIKFNQPLNFDTSNVISMEGMFYKTNIFNQPIIFDISKATIMSYMFEKTKAFLDKYNKGESFPLDTKEIKKWFNINRDKMNEIDIKETQGEELDCFFLKFDNTYSQNNNFTNIHSKN